MSVIVLGLCLGVAQADPPATDLGQAAADLEAELDAGLATQVELCQALGIVCETPPPDLQAPPDPQAPSDDDTGDTAAPPPPPPPPDPPKPAACGRQ